MALTDSLISYWKLDEASGTRSDSVGSNHLTDTNTVTQAAGKLGNAAQFVSANSEYLSIASNASLQVGGLIDWTFAGWFQIASSGLFAIAGKDAVGTPEWSMYGRSSTNRWEARAWNGVGFQVAAKDVAIALNTWYWLCVQYTTSTRTLTLDVNNSGTPGSVVLTGDIPNGADGFWVGKTLSGFSYLDGLADGLGLWKRKLTDPEQAQVYNGGAGLDYPFGRRKRGLVSVTPLVRALRGMRRRR